MPVTLGPGVPPAHRGRPQAAPPAFGHPTPIDSSTGPLIASFILVRAMPATTVIVEREQACAPLAQSIAAADDGQGHLVLIDGPAGIGKTRLLAEMRQRAAS